MSTINPFEAPNDADEQQPAAEYRSFDEISALDVWTLTLPRQPWGRVVISDQDRKPMFVLEPLPAWRVVAAYSLTAFGVIAPILGLLAWQTVPPYVIGTMIVLAVTGGFILYNRSRRVVRYVNWSDGSPVWTLRCTLSFLGRRTVQADSADNREGHDWQEVSSSALSNWLGSVSNQPPDLVIMAESDGVSKIYRVIDQHVEADPLAKISNDAKNRTIRLEIADPAIDRGRLPSILFAIIPPSNLFWDI